MDGHRFNLGDSVRIVESGEVGTVVGRAEYNYCEPGVLVRYRRGDGCAGETWWTQSALAAVPEPPHAQPIPVFEAKATTGGGGGVDEALPAVGSDADDYGPELGGDN